VQNTFEHKHTERALLACILQKPDLLIELDNTFGLDAFKSPINKTILEEALRLYEMGYSRLDNELIFNAVFMRGLPDLTNEQIVSYINSLLQANVHEVNFHSYLNDLFDVHMKDRLNTILTSNTGRLYTEREKTPALELIGSVQNQLYTIDNRIGTEDVVDVFASMRDTVLERRENPEQFRGISTGFPLLDQIILGWLKTKFYFVSARPSVGKSTLLMQWAIKGLLYSKQDVRVLYLDTEIGGSEFTIRTAAHISAVNGLKLLAGEQLDEKSMDVLNRSFDFVEQYKDVFHHKYIPGFKRSQVINLIKKYVYNHGVNLVVLDYIKEPEGGEENRAGWQVVGDLARNFKDTMGELDITGLSALQQNRKGEGKSRVEGEAFAESDRVLQYSDVAFMLNRKSGKEVKEEGIEAGTHRLQLHKARYTKRLYNGINLRFYGHCFRFEEAALQQTIGNTEDAEPVTIEEETPLPKATYGAIEPLFKIG